MSSSAMSLAGMVSLAALTFQCVAIAMAMRVAATSHSGFVASTAVCCDEALKLTFCVLMMVYLYATKPAEQDALEPRLVARRPRCSALPETQPLRHEQATSFCGFYHFFRGELCDPGVLEYLKMSVPAALFTVQKNLLYLALKNLHPVLYQVTSQSKVLTTAFFSYVILGRYLHCNQVLALLLLGGGIAMAQVSAFHDQVRVHDAEGDILLGVAAVQMASLTSGLASVYFEYMLKQSGPVTDYSLWVRNIQLASFALPIALITAFVMDGSSISQNGFFHGYLPIHWVVICLEAIGGIFVALVTKHADSILKIFATSLAIVISAALCTVYLGFSVTPLFAFGACMVLTAIFLYSHAPGPMAEKLQASLDQLLEGGNIQKLRKTSLENKILMHK